MCSTAIAVDVKLRLTGKSETAWSMKRLDVETYG